jgi:hypothetical protein
MRCPHCPAPTDAHCRGEEVPRYCTLVDPDSPSHKPEYSRILVSDDVQVTDAMRAEWAIEAEARDPNPPDVPRGKPCGPC